MPPPATKRRKTGHVASDGEDDNASFASFGDEGGQDGEMEVSQVLSGEEMVESEEEEENQDESGESGSASDVSRDGPNDTITGRGKQPQAKARIYANDHTKSKATAQLGTGAYANGTFKSNVFKLQVDELLQQIQPRNGLRELAAESALHTLKKSIEQIPAKGPFLVADAERDLIKEKVAVPFPNPRPPKDAQYKFSFAKPANINVVGSFALKTASRSRDMVEVDMIVTMPGSLFEEKDYLNYRYFYKRAYYLACLAAGLKAIHKAEFSMRFRPHHDNSLKPILVIGPIGKTATSPNEQSPALKWRLNVIPCASQDQFPPEKLSLDKSNVRNQTADKISSCTPFYNSSLRSDMLMLAYLKLIHSAKKGCEAFTDACLMGSAWLRQRGFGSSIEAGGFGNFEWAAIIAVCLQGGGPNYKSLLSSGYSSYQLFKATLQILAMKDFAKQPLVVDASMDVPKPSGGIPIVWDGSRSHNLLFKLSPWSYKNLRYEAKSTLNALGDQMFDGFDATFIWRVHEPLYSYDCVVLVSAQSLEINRKTRNTGIEPLVELYNVLSQGLDDRIHRMVIQRPEAATWDLGSARPQGGIKGDIKIGFMVNSDTVKRTVDQGPPAEKKTAAADFRKFWGAKAELRRFKDGSILESLVWSSPAESGCSVLEQLVRYLLGHQFGLVTTDDMVFFGEGFSRLIRGGGDRMVFEPLMERYKQFENDIRNLRDLPLSIRQIMPADAQLRYASVIPPLSVKQARRSTPSEVAIQFEGSSRWPDELRAIQRTKIAFLLKLSKLLDESVDSITTRIGYENEGEDILNQAYLDVTYGLDATFRLRIFHDREQTLHERKLKDKTIDPKARELSAVGLAKYKRDHIKSPAHTQAIARLCSRHSALSGAIRLTKRWFASHLLASHIANEVIELMVVRTFTQPWPWQTPSSVQTGFLRTLFWLSRWDWRAEPLIVDLSVSGELKDPDVRAINTNFEAWRKLDPGMNRVALFAASNVDHDGTTWTDGKPAKVVAGRMSALAKAACAEVAQKQLQLEPASLFSSPLEDFSFVLHLNPLFSGGKAKKAGKNGASTTTFKNLELESLHDTTLIGFDPVKNFLDDLESTYGSAILFFYGGGERPIIAGLWSPLTARRNWKVNLAYSTTPAKDNDGDEVMADLNCNAILSEMARIGGDLIERVEVL